MGLLNGLQLLPTLLLLAGPVPLSTTTDFAGNIGRGNIGENGNWENDVMSLVERKAQQDGGGNPVNPVDASGDDRRLRAGDC
eukprot:COSAG01_NODE_18153_length_1096_cov_26.127197_1_plen_82_part_00